MTRVLFVCHGNICRSPMAELIFRDMIKRAGMSDRVECASAATSDEELGNPVYPPVRRLLESIGLDCSGKTARRLTASDYERYDMLIGMDAANLRNMRRMLGGDPAGKMHLLLSFAGETRDVADPWYTRDFRQCLRDVELGCRALLESLRNADERL